MGGLFSLFRSRLSARFVLLTLLLLLIVQIVGFLIIRATVNQHVKEEARNSIAVSERIWNQLLTQSHERLQTGAQVLAADFGFRTAVASQDSKTITSALENNAHRIGASVAILVDTQWNLEATYSADSLSAENLVFIIQNLGKTLGNMPKNNNFFISLFNGQPTQFVLVPVRAPRVIGYVLMGFAIQQSKINEASELSGNDIALLSKDSNGTATILSNSEQISRFFKQHPIEDYFLADSQPDLFLNHQTYMTRITGENIVDGYLSIIFLKSLKEASARFDELGKKYLYITGVSIIIFGLFITWLSRRVTQPLVALTKVTTALEQGDFNIQVSGSKRFDEIGVLARSFDGMRISINDQREKISQLAYFDSLTSLPNRISFKNHVEKAINSELYEYLCVITINLDRFKQVNDLLGYEVGDQILKATAKRITQLNFLNQDFIARISGDEFAVLVTPNHLSGLQIAREMQRQLKEPLEINEAHIDLSASIGVASWPKDAANSDDLINASQVAMYSAKTRREDVVIYRDELVTSTPENLSLLSELRRAVINNELRVFLQPKVNTKNNQVVSAEALIRWQHDTNGMVAPFHFVPFAENTGFVRELTKWVICEVVSKWHSLQPVKGLLRISINLSIYDLMTSDLAEFLQITLDKHAVPASGLCFEITESAIMDDPKFVEQTLSKLATMGFKLSIDDFGTGYSSLGYLRHLPVNELKIDQSFIFGMLDNPNDRVIVQSTIDLAHSLGLNVVAEGVETEAMHQALRELGCEEVQGYLISMPMYIDDFVQWRCKWENKHCVEPI